VYRCHDYVYGCHGTNYAYNERRGKRRLGGRTHTRGNVLAPQLREKFDAHIQEIIIASQEERRKGGSLKVLAQHW